MSRFLAPLLAILFACGSAGAVEIATPEPAPADAEPPKYKRKLPKLEDRKKRNEEENPSRFLGEKRKYFGIGLGTSTMSSWSTAETLDDGSFVSEGGDDRDSGLQLFGGIEVGNHAFELGYAELGGATYEAMSDGSSVVWSAGPIRETLDASAIQFSYQYSYPITARTRLFGRVGFQKWSTDAAYGGTTQSLGAVRFEYGTSDWDELLGAGVAFDLTPRWRLRGAYMLHRLNQDNGAEREARMKALELSIMYRY
jgi:hypothetical protein